MRRTRRALLDEDDGTNGNGELRYRREMEEEAE